MKRLSLLTILIGMMIYADGQESLKYMTIPNLPSGVDYMKKIVVLAYDKEKEDCNSSELLLASFFPDKLIGDKKYKIFRKPFLSGSAMTYNSYYFRQEDNQVYRYYEDIGSERLVYDFSLTVGDIILKNERMRLKVVDVGTAADFPAVVSDVGTDRNMLHLRGVEDPSVEDWWIEGVGSVYTGLLDESDFPTDETFLESMYFQETSDAYDDEQVRLVYETHYLKSYSGRGESLATSAVMKEYRTFLQNDSRVLVESLDDTLHINGFIYLHSPMFVSDAFINGDNVTVTVNDISSLNYWDQRPGEVYKIDMKFSGFQQGTYTVQSPHINNTISPVKTQVVTFGKEKKGDVNSDGEVDISDIVAIINVMAGTDGNISADVNHDGKTDISDITAIVNIMAGQK